MSLPPEKKQELREMSRMQALQVVSEVLRTYRLRKASGRIVVDIRSGKAIWVRPVVRKVDVTGEPFEEGRVYYELNAALREFQVQRASGTVTLVVREGRVASIEKAIELDKVRVG